MVGKRLGFLYVLGKLYYNANISIYTPDLLCKWWGGSIDQLFRLSFRDQIRLYTNYTIKSTRGKCCSLESGLLYLSKVITKLASSTSLTNKFCPINACMSNRPANPTISSAIAEQYQYCPRWDSNLRPCSYHFKLLPLS